MVLHILLPGMIQALSVHPCAPLPEIRCGQTGTGTGLGGQKKGTSKWNQTADLMWRIEKQDFAA